MNLAEAQEALQLARAERDKLPHSPARSALNAALDRIDVLVAELGHRWTLSETVHWTPVTEAMPDDDTTVLVRLEGNDEPTWLGWWDGAGWCDVCTGEYFSGRVVAWAPTLKGAPL